MNSARLQNEPINDYFFRICDNRIAYGLTWNDVRDLMNDETGHDCGESKYRKDWSLYKKGYDEGVAKTIDSDETFKKYEEAIQTIKEEKVKLRDNRNALSQQIRVKSKFDNIVEELKATMSETLEPLVFVAPKKREDEEKILVAAFSDFHVGAEFKNFFGEYSIPIFKRRLEEYADKIISIGSKEGANSLIVLALGDCISGSIHVSTRIQNAENVVQQVKIVSEYTAQALCKLSSHFKSIEYHTAFGNHGRVTPSKEETLYEENFESFVPWWISERVKDIPNIRIMNNEIDSGIIVANVFDSVITAVHGDKDRIAQVATNLPVMIKKFPISIWTAHLHSFGVETKHGIEIIKSGCLSGTDEYAKDKRLTGKPCQTVAIYDREGLVSVSNINFK